MRTCDLLTSTLVHELHTTMTTSKSALAVLALFEIEKIGVRQTIPFSIKYFTCTHYMHATFKVKFFGSGPKVETRFGCLQLRYHQTRYSWSLRTQFQPTLTIVWMGNKTA